MAVHHRNTASSHTQEPPLTIARVALYARVSTLNGQDPEMQLSELREYASRRGWTITTEYVDQGVSGSKESRPELNLACTPISQVAGPSAESRFRPSARIAPPHPAPLSSLPASGQAGS
jgi:hypothetical protein